MEAIGQLTAVTGVLTLLVTTLWWLRRRGYVGVAPARGKTGKRLEFLERLPLGPQHTLHLVRLGDTALLLASSPAGCALVQSFPNGEIDPRREAAR